MSRKPLSPDVAPEGRRAAPALTPAAQDDLTRRGQRTINLMWEATQGAIAILITLAIVYCAVTRIASAELVNAFFLIIGFYFSRTNHTAIGGVGRKPGQDYIGR